MPIRNPAARITRPRVITTDVEQRAALAVIRCLSDAGYDVTAVGSSRWAPGLWSQTPGRRRVAPDPSEAVEPFLARLEEIVRRERHDVLIAGTDASLLAISRARARFEPHVRIGMPTHELVERALDRTRMAREAARVGLEAPAGCVCESTEDAVAAASSFGFPVLVKPRRTVIDPGGKMFRRASVLAHDANAVRDAAQLFGGSIVQQRVDAAVISFGGVVADGALLAFAISRYARTWPPKTGNAAFSETIEPPAGLAERVEALVAGLGWEGIFELELLEYGNGAFGAIDFNPRPYGSLALAVAAGVPLPALWCDRVLGEHPKRVRGRIGIRYRWEDAELRHLGWQLREGHVRSALAMLGAHRHVAHAYFQLRDPAPWLARIAELTRTAVGRRGELRLRTRT